MALVVRILVVAAAGGIADDIVAELRQLGVGVEGLRETDIIFGHGRPVHVFDRRRRPGASLTVRSTVVIVLGYFACARIERCLPSREP